MQNEIKEKIKEAMRAKDAVALNVYRGISTAIMNELVSKGKTPQDILSDEDCVAVVRRLSKQRKDSIEQFEKGGRTDLAEDEKKELVVLEALLPSLMSKEEVLKIAQAKKAELGITDKTKIGQFLGALMKDLKGKADGAVVKEVAEGLFE
jgi:uncharacterized protein YqeY